MNKVVEHIYKFNTLNLHLLQIPVDKVGKDSGHNYWGNEVEEEQMVEHTDTANSKADQKTH